jgi:hypothetical protein
VLIQYCTGTTATTTLHNFNHTNISAGSINVDTTTQEHGKSNTVIGQPGRP